MEHIESKLAVKRQPTSCALAARLSAKTIGSMAGLLRGYTWRIWVAARVCQAAKPRSAEAQ